MNIHFERLSLNHIEMGWLKWIQNIDPHANTEFARIPPNKESLIKIVDSTNDNDIWLAALYSEDSNPSDRIYFANVHIAPINWIDRRCTFGRLIGDPSIRGKGLGTLLTKSIVNYCFTSLNMYKVTAGCLSTNQAAIKSNLKAGMTQEAILKRDRFYNKEYVDSYLFAAWNDNWNSQLL